MVTGVTDAAVDWLRSLEPEGPWLLVAINPDPERDQDGKVLKSGEAAHLGDFGPETEIHLRTWIDLHQGSWNLYYTSNLPLTPFRTSKKEAVQQIRILHVDLDLPGAADDEELAAKLLARLQSLAPPPTAIVWTGGGYQAIWLLEEKLPAADWLDRIERINTAIWEALGGDHCHDISRLLRLPGTVNVPNAKKRARGRVPELARVVEADWSRRWSFSNDEVPTLPVDLIPTATTATATIAGSTPWASLSPTLQKLIITGNTTQFGNDRSRLGWFVMCELLRRGWEDQEIVKLFLDPAYGISAHYREQSTPAAYTARNLARAREAVANDWNRHPKTKQVLGKDQENIDKALRQLGVKLSYDMLSDQRWMNGAGPLRKLSDPEVDSLWLKIQREFGWLPDEKFFDTVLKNRARERSYHPILEYLERVEPTWDGVHRIGNAQEGQTGWLTAYGGVEDTTYTRAVGRLTLVAAVRRIRVPGCKFDEMLMLVDPNQGTNKSTAIRALCHDENWFSDSIEIGSVGREAIENIRGFWILEAQEMMGMSTRQLEKIKSFCSRQTDRGRMSYDRLMTDLPRSCIFIGTSNEEHLFLDLLNRRFWPVSLGHEFDTDQLKADRDQLWAEAAQAERRGESIRLPREYWPLAAVEQAKHRSEEAWATVVDKAIGLKNGRITSPDIYRIINRSTGNVSHVDSVRLGRAMKEIGFKRRQMRVEDSPNPRWFYVRGTEKEQWRDLIVYPDVLNHTVFVDYAPDDLPEADHNYDPRRPNPEIPF